MNDLTIMEKIKNRINDAKEGSIFIANDFIDISSLETANRCLSRLNQKGIIRRVMRGIYDKPQFSQILQKFVLPNLDDVINAIARSNGWSIAPDSDLAMNLLGVSTQVPNELVYVSSGPYKKYICDLYPKSIIKFKHTSNKNINNMSRMSATFVQAIIGKGKDRIYDETINLLKSRLTEENKKVLILETQNTSSWVYEVIKKICSDNNK